MDRPRLRKVERIAAQRDGETLLVLRDPLGFAEPFAIDAAFAEVLDLLDGTRSVGQIRQSLLMRGAMDLPAGDLAEFVDALSDAGWLDDAAFKERWSQEVATFEAEDPRPPTLAGVAYPADPDQIRQELHDAIGEGCTQPGANVVGVLVPHSPPSLCAGVLAQTLRGLPPADEVELVVVLGVDYMGGLLPIVATDKRYATPLGTLRSDDRTFAALKRRVPWIDRELVRHRSAGSLELAALYLQYIYGQECPPLLPILCGQTMLNAPDDDDDDGELERFFAVMEGLCEDRGVLFWASAELTHAGPAYGGEPVGKREIAAIEQRDRAVIAALERGVLKPIVELCSEAHPQGRPSGGAVVAALSQLLPQGFRTEIATYDPAPAPGTEHGIRGLAGLRFRVS